LQPKRLHPVRSLPEPFAWNRQRKAHESLTCLTEAGTRRSKNSRLPEQPLGERHRAISPGNFRPQIEGGLGTLATEPQLPERSDHQIAPRLVNRAVLVKLLVAALDRK